MYAFIAKGYSVGNIITRRLLRNLTSFPGFILDAAIIAPFWWPHYQDFWSGSRYLQYADGEKAFGLFCPLVGWLGDRVGYVMGALIGTLLGFTLSVPDCFLRFTQWSYQASCQALSEFSCAVSQHILFKNQTYQNPLNHYIQHSWNISIATIGFLLGTVLFCCIRLIEIVFPTDNKMTQWAWKIGLYTGASIGIIMGFILYPLTSALATALKLYDRVSESIENIIAFVYAKSNTVPYEKNSDNCVPNEYIHSQSFREKVNKIKMTSTMTLLYGQILLPENQTPNTTHHAPTLDQNATPPSTQKTTHLPKKSPPIRKIRRKKTPATNKHPFEERNIKLWITSEPHITPKEQSTPIAFMS